MFDLVTEIADRQLVGFVLRCEFAGDCIWVLLKVRLVLDPREIDASSFPTFSDADNDWRW